MNGNMENKGVLSEVTKLGCGQVRSFKVRLVRERFII